MATATLITYQDVPIPKDIGFVEFTIPDGKTVGSASIINLPGYTEELGINGRSQTGNDVIQQLRGEDTLDGQHLLRIQLTEDIEVGSGSSDNAALIACLDTLIAS